MKTMIATLAFVVSVVFLSASSDRRAAAALGLNISHVLSEFPDYATLNTLLSQTGVAKEINQRSSLTLLAPEDSVLDPLLSQLSQSVTGQQIADILRYHVLLEYEGVTGLRTLPDRTKLFTTLFQTTGRAVKNSGYVNITDEQHGGVFVGWPSSATVFNSEVLSTVKEIPFNISIVGLSRVIVPGGLLPPSLMPLFVAPPPPPLAPSPSSSRGGGSPSPASASPASSASSPGMSPFSPPQARSSDEGGSESSSAVAAATGAIAMLFFTLALLPLLHWF